MRQTRNAAVTLLLLLAAGAVCAGQTGGSGSAQTKSAAVDLDAQLIAHERQVLEAIKGRSQAAFTALVDPNGWGVTADGAQVISAVLPQLFDPAITVSEYRLEQPKVLWVDKDTAVVSYKSIATYTAGGKTQTEVSQASTVWHRRGGKWVAVFHQTSTPPGSQPEGSPPK